jgi:UPF0755 protein
MGWIIRKLHFLKRWFLLFSRGKNGRVRLAIAAAIILWVLFYISVYQAPHSFVAGKVVRVSEGATLLEISEQLKKEDVIRSPLWFRMFVIVLGGEKGIIAGDYYFRRQQGLGGVAAKLVTGSFGIEPYRVTIPEGSSVKDIAALMEEKSLFFSGSEFIRIASAKEGYLFPDTYFFLPSVDEEQVAIVLESTFWQQLDKVRDEIREFGRSTHEVITMASILEREANTMETRRVIAGILWKRLDEGIPLQVDAVFDYINGKNTFDLTLEDLEINSPYNTYRNQGLPPGPIANPGLDAIYAAITPIESEYYFFLADRSGNVHYSRTFEEHKQKKARYLN